MYQKNQNQTQVPNLNNASVQHPSTSQPGGMVPEARQALEDMKYEIAGELGINLKQGYNGDLTSREAGSVGGQMVKKMCTIRSANYPRPARTAIGHEVNVRYIASVTI